MSMQSLRQFQIRAVTAGTARIKMLTPDRRFRSRDVVILGATNFARVSHYENLGWPSQTLFAEYNSEFSKSTGALGYAKPVSMKGRFVRVHLISDHQADELAIRNHQQLIGAEIKFFNQWLKTRDHPNRPNWPQQVQRLSQAVAAFGARKFDLETLIYKFEQAFDRGTIHQTHRTHTLVQQARSISVNYERRLDARLPVAYLLIDVQNVTHFLYRDERDILFNTDAEDAAHRRAGDFNRFMFERVQLQKTEFARRSLPFYDPTWLADQRARNQPVWELSQLDAYHLGG